MAGVFLAIFLLSLSLSDFDSILFKSENVNYNGVGESCQEFEVNNLIIDFEPIAVVVGSVVRIGNSPLEYVISEFHYANETSIFTITYPRSSEGVGKYDLPSMTGTKSVPPCEELFINDTAVVGISVTNIKYDERHWGKIIRVSIDLDGRLLTIPFAYHDRERFLDTPSAYFTRQETIKAINDILSYLNVDKEDRL
ncbi:hypothetical protein F9L16_17660 [Agarivorans sp. B2Z047]|uniref:hypothetical protein n=1 Tax=Agarivorans sp. B2Z047 TaxID=2652721 RepID=UPI00128B07F1|nr:hypothetical protein [Agarivorans sp. B2Z047]MPW30816.1 hypothetical protein [Agarivorans sp. B2Z047]UQN40953.1 hypothetical protein LQZ07_14345 [Agarivorans sp. B2Z047]